jgi:hypothetical protein
MRLAPGKVVLALVVYELFIKPKPPRSPRGNVDIGDAQLGGEVGATSGLGDFSGSNGNVPLDVYT